jgi:hypothetical protein
MAIKNITSVPICVRPPNAPKAGTWIPIYVKTKTIAENIEA